MLNNVIRWSIQNRWLVSFIGLCLLVFGMFSASHIPIDVFPDFAPTQVIIQTEAPGYAPEEVESLVTLPLESSLNGTAKVEIIRSLSTVGLSVITVTFEDGANVFTARQLVNERLQLAQSKLPAGVQQPKMDPVTSAVGIITRYGIISTAKTSLTELRTISDWTIRPRLRAVYGVSNITAYGGDLKQYQILVNPDALKNYNLTIDNVIHAAEESNQNTPGGLLRNGEEEYLIRGVGRAKSIDDIAHQVIKTIDGTPITLDKVATVKIGAAFKMSDAVVNGQQGIVLSIYKQPWANTLETTERVEKVITEVENSLPKDVKIIPTFRQADFINTAVHNVLEALILGGILVVVILFVFLQNWRTALISLTAIPLSLLVAIMVLKWQGGTINTMTLGGLAIAIGEVVDDAIIDVENVYRRLRENKHSATPRNPLKVVFDASKEIRTSVIYATYIVALVFLPILSLGGLEGKIFSPLALSYIIAILASLGVALTLIPALCCLLLINEKDLPTQETTTIVWLKLKYETLLKKALNHPKTIIIGAALLFLISLVPLAVIGKAFLPEFDESNLVIAVSSAPGTSLTTTLQTGITLTKHLKKHDEVLAADQRAGRAEASDDYGGSNFSEFDVRLTEGGAERRDLIHHVRDDFQKIPGIILNIGSYIAHRIDEVLSGVRAAIAIKISGPDLETLRQKAKTVEHIMSEIPGAVDVQMEPVIPIPQISIEIDRDKAARYGLSSGDLSRTIEAAYKGVVVSQIIEAQKTFDLLVWFQPEYRDNSLAMAETLVDTPSGIKVPLGSIAKVITSTSPNMIRHENMIRTMVVQANVSHRDLGSVVTDARDRISKDLKLPQGYTLNIGGQFEAQEKATQQLVVLTAIAIAGIFVLLFMAFRSVKAALLIMANLPLALIGGLWAIFISGGVLSIGSLVGFITLFGISCRNGIMLVTHFNHLLKEGKAFDDVLWQGSLDRLVPVLMTALTAALGVLPIAILGGAGRELEQPLAIVILGGMVTSTLLTLVVIPALFKLFGHDALICISDEREEMEQF